MIFNYKNILNDLARNDNSLHQITTVEKENLIKNRTFKVYGFFVFKYFFHMLG